MRRPNGVALPTERLTMAEYSRLTTTDEDGVVADFLVFGGTEEEAKDAAVVVHTYDPDVEGVAMAALTLRQARELQHLLDTVLGPF